jgi:hypothetical protein
LLGATWFLVAQFVGFNYLTTFKFASAYENPQGFSLLSGSKGLYLFTRLEDVTEIVLFFGPILSLLALRGISAMKRTNSPHLRLFGVAVFSLMSMFIVGTYRTGETARGAMFIYPFLILPVAAFLHDFADLAAHEKTLLALVFVQSIVMQLIGNYLW